MSVRSDMPTASASAAEQGGTRWGWSIAALAATALGSWALISWFVRSRTGQWADALALEAMARESVRDHLLVQQTLDVVSVEMLVVACAVLAVIAALQRRWLDALRAVAIVAAANLAVQALKLAIERPDFGIGNTANSLPSGHTAVAASLAAALLVVAPRALMPLVSLLGALYVALTALATIAAGWHRPSDVVASIAVVTFVAVLIRLPGAAGLGREAGSSGRIALGWLYAIGTLLCLGIGAVVLIWLVRTYGDVEAARFAVSTGLPRGALVATAIGAFSGVVGATCAGAWAQLLARR